MPSKRKRPAQNVDSKSEDSDLSTPVPNKKKKKAPYDPIEICQDLYETIRNYKTDDGRLLCEAFIRAPKRRTAADYYDIVSTPIDLLKIQQKLKTDEYDELDQFAADIELMVNNTKAYYRKSSQEYKDACDLWEIFQATRNELISEVFGEPSPAPSLPLSTPSATATSSVISMPTSVQMAPTPQPAISCAAAAAAAATAAVAAAAAESAAAAAAAAAAASGSTAAGGGGSSGMTPGPERRRSARKNQLESVGGGGVVMGAGGGGGVVGGSIQGQRGGGGGVVAGDEEDVDDDDDDDEMSKDGIPPLAPTVASSSSSSSSTHHHHTPRPSVAGHGTNAAVAMATPGTIGVTTAAMTTPSDPISSEDAMEINQLYTAIITAKDGERDISEVFQRLPPRSKYPKYYEIIKEPIDLKLIAQRIQEDYYPNVTTLEKDLLLMIKNAKTFNEPRSQVYRDAVTLRKLIMNRKHESDARKAVKSSARIRELQNIQKLCLKDQCETESDMSSWQGSTGSYDDDCFDFDDRTLWSLYFTVKNYKNVLGQNLAEPFYKLPSQRQYPDYYEEIKHPMALFNVRKKIKKLKYRNLDDLAADMSLIFENARHYNTDESSLYKDACRLQKIMMDKKKELEKFEVKDTVGPMLKYELPPVVAPESGYQVPKMERDSWDDDQTPRALKSRKSLLGSAEFEKKKLLRRSIAVTENTLQKRLWALYKSVYDFCDTNDRYLREIFMTLPLKRDYPDYYRVIMEPIDMSIIEIKIKTDKYISELKLIADFELMFNNARHYNEEDSQVYHDAGTLERVLKNKWKSLLAHQDTIKKAPGKSKSRSKCVSPLCMKLQDLFDTIKDHADSRGRMLSAPFLKLPLKTEYPDYYEVIKRPIDMQRIQQRVASNQYESVDDMVADFVQMFDNACKYNEPDSLIYKDALTLQRVCLEKKLELSLDGVNEVPDVQAIVQELMTNLFISVYNYQDEEGRCYSDSFAELPERDPDEELESGEPKEKPLTFDQIKRNLNKGRYVRVDRFQEDMFKVFDRARQLSRTDSQLYEDAIEMQLFFIKIRDELCKNGEILLTPALSYTEKHLQAALETEKKDKFPKEQQDEEKKRNSETEEKMATASERMETSIKYRDQIYSIGDFVYIEPRENGLEPHIMCIEKLFHDNAGLPALHGNWFYRPNETFHLATRKFLEKEVFKSEFSTTIPLSQLLGPKCYVMFVKDYFKMRPQGFADKDVYVCESRYNARHKAFKKIKVWQMPASESMKLNPRDQVVSPVRVASVFADKSKENEKDDLDDGTFNILDKNRENVELEVYGPEYAGSIYYEQYNTPSGSYKLGDCVHIKSTEEKPFIARIDKIWVTAGGNIFFYGPLFVRPSDVEHSPTRMFYCREVFYSCKETSFPAMTVIGRCAVLHIKDYCSYRITEVAEQNVYICESKYLETERSIRKLAKGLKKYSLSQKVTDDELYFFKKHIVPQKEPSPLLPEAVDTEELEDEEKLEYPVVTTPNKSLNVSYEETTPLLPEKPNRKEGGTADRTRKSKSNSNIKRQPSGYIVFAGEIRKQIQQENPDCSFGDISRIVGTKWRNLNKDEKERFEEKAKKLAEEQAAKQEAAEKAFNESLNNPQSPWSDYSRSMSPAAGTAGTMPNGQPIPGNFQNQFGFQSFQGVHHPGLAVPNSVQQQRGGVVPAAMVLAPGAVGGVNVGVSGGGIIGGDMSPSGAQQHHQHQHHHHHHQQQQQLLLHQQQGQGLGQRHVYMSPFHLQQQQQQQQHHHYQQQHQQQHHHHLLPGMRYPGLQPVPGGQQMAPPPQPRPPSPIFVAVPPRTQRLLHSEAYIRYIEGLNSNSRCVSDWNKTLNATPETITTQSEKRLPTHWMSHGSNYHGSISNALWALRDLMLKDTLNITKTLPFDDLCVLMV